jgi:hypothetical protein
MMAIDDRLRAAMRAAAGTAPNASARPLRLPKRRFSWGSHAMIAPLATALAMTALIAGIVTVRSTGRARHIAVTAPPAALRLLPRYEVALTYAGRLTPWLWLTKAVVASTATGRPLATIRPPAPYNTFAAVSGSADGRTYVLAARRLFSNPRAPQSPTQFYEVQVHARAATLTPLPTPILRAMTFGDMAVSPDGSRLAITGTGGVSILGYGPGFIQAGVRIYDLATGKLEHAWPVAPAPPPGKCCVFDPTAAAPSWEANGRYLALDVSLAHCQDCVMLLDTAASGTSVQAVGRVIARTHNRHYPEQWTNTLITPDGSQLLRSAMVGVQVTRHTFYDVPHFFRYSVRSAATTLSLRGSRNVRWQVVWSSPSGRWFVVVMVEERGFPGFPTAAIYWRHHLAQLPLPTKTLAVAW